MWDTHGDHKGMLHTNRVDWDFPQNIEGMSTIQARELANNICSSRSTGKSRDKVGCLFESDISLSFDYQH